MSNEASYTFGNCTYYVAKVLSWIPAGFGDAKDWLAKAQAAGLPTTNIATPGSAVVYGAGQGYSGFGHVAIVQSVNGDGTFNVSEMNFNGFNQVDTRRSSMNDVLGFILPPGTKPDSGSQFIGGTSGSPLPGTTLTGFSLPGVPDLSGLQKILTFLTNSKNWWKIGFTAVGVYVVWLGFELYFLKDEQGAVEQVAKEGAFLA